MADHGNKDDWLTGAFQGALNQHGDVFQHAVRSRASQLNEAGESCWTVGPSEFPVSVRGRDARIDFILEQEPPRGDVDSVHIVAECKRANPSLKYWCFAKAAVVTRGDDASRWLIAEHLVAGQDGPWRAGAALVRPITQRHLGPYHLAMEIKQPGGDGDRHGNPRGAIEEAAAQAYRGVNGMVDYFRRARDERSGIYGAIVIPVIFTTASIYTTDTELSRADLLTGNLAIEGSLQPKNWIYYQYPGSVGLKHSLERLGTSPELDNVVVDEYLRTIPIVSASGVDEFLKTFSVRARGVQHCP